MNQPRNKSRSQSHRAVKVTIVNQGFTPKHLGTQSQRAIDTLDLIPWKGGHTVVTLNATEFTSHCPVTKQPDFGQLVIEYCPDKHLVETKSMKLYLWQFRDRAEFNESIVDSIATDLFRQVKPVWLTVTGHFNTRGGIAVTAKAERYR